MDNEKLKRTLEKEINHHCKKETLYMETEQKFKSHNAKRIKHMHKRHKTIAIAEKLGFKFCECCGGLRLR